jgi:hypothetical protein
MAIVRTTPPGQPSAPDEEQRSERAELRLTPRESAAYAAAAEANGLTVSRWMRQNLAQAAMTKSATTSPIALKNAWAVKDRLAEIHRILVGNPAPPSEVNKAVMWQIVLLREPVNFLINYLISERAT